MTGARHPAASIARRNGSSCRTRAFCLTTGACCLIQAGGGGGELKSRRGEGVWKADGGTRLDVDGRFVLCSAVSGLH